MAPTVSWKVPVIRMVLRGVVLLLIYANCQKAIGTDEGIQLVNMEQSLCLAVVLGSDIPLVRSCEDNDPHQKWRLIGETGKRLQNLGTDQCLQNFPTLVLLKMRACDSSVSDQVFHCVFNSFKTNAGSDYLAANAEGELVLGGDPKLPKTRWQNRHDREESVCNSTRFAEIPKWRMIGGVGESAKVESGLSRWIVALDSDGSVFIFDSTGRYQKITGIVSSLSVGTKAFWGINPNHGLYFHPTATLALGNSDDPWEYIEGGFVILDFSVPGKGFVVKTDGQFCARLGMNDTNPKGSGWQCVQESVTISKLSCGVTGCFSIISRRVNFRNGISAGNPVGTSWVALPGPMTYVAAGPTYEVWGIASEKYIYRRIGVSDQTPMGIEWEVVHGIRLTTVNFGIFGPVGLSSRNKEIVMSNGLVKPVRQRELDRLCESLATCERTSYAQTSGDQCHARYGPNTTTYDLAWRCYTQEALSRDGHTRRRDSTKYFTRDTELEALAYRTPVLGDFLVQLWLDQVCSDPRQNNKALCQIKCFQRLTHHASFDSGYGLFVCRPTCPASSCGSARTHALNDKLFDVTRASCGEIPLTGYANLFPNSAYSASRFYYIFYPHNARINSGSGWCPRWTDINEEFLEFDFQFLHKICAIATERAHGRTEFVESFMIQYSVDHETWNYSTVFGSPQEFTGNVNGHVKHFLPAPVEARYLQIRPIVGTSPMFCLKAEVFGSSRETEADSCEYYQTHLYATYDGFYHVYFPENGTKRRVFCYGLNDDKPAKTVLVDDGNAIRLSWSFDTPQDEDTSFELHGRKGIKFLPNQTKILGNFPQTCIVEPSLCFEGLTIEMWLWFSCPSPFTKTYVLLSGSPDKRYGFGIYIKDQEVCFEYRTSRKTWETCVGDLGNAQKWLHLLAAWHPDYSPSALIVDDPANRVEDYWLFDLRDSAPTNTLLSLGKLSDNPDEKCSIAVSSLSIWTRKLLDEEIEAAFRDVYLLADAGESCTSACEKKQRSCYPVMNTNITETFNGLKVNCTRGAPASDSSEVQPFVNSARECFGLENLPDKLCCDCKKDTLRRLCRCEQPVDGSFTEWSPWSFCSTTCGSGRRTRTRSCANPAPSFGGNECAGPSTMIEECHKPPCDDYRGVWRRIWLGPGESSYPTHTDIVETFLSPSLPGEYYVRRQLLKAYFRPPTTGSYKFVLKCAIGRCELWFSVGHGEKERIVKINPHESARTRTSGGRSLSRTQSYTLFADHFPKSRSASFLGVGWQLDTVETEFPIAKEHLIWKANDPQGISREIWKTYSVWIVRITELENHIQSYPTSDHRDIIDDFASIRNFGSLYGQRLRSFFLAPVTGNYSFSLSCSLRCHLVFSPGDDTDNKIIILKVPEPIGYHDRLTNSQNAFQAMEAGKFYFLEVLHVDTMVEDYIILGVTFPDGTSSHPINKRYLWQEIPENLAFSRPASQASEALDWTAANVVDGDPGSCAKTHSGVDPWWRVFMHRTKVLSVTVTITGPPDHRLDNFTIRVGDSLTNNGALNPSCNGSHSISSGETRVITCSSEVTGKYLSVHIDGPARILTLCELAIYGFVVPDLSSGLGLADGRVEKHQLSASSSQPSHHAHYARLFHPSKSWCGVKDSPNKLTVLFKERKYVRALATQGYPGRESWVSKYQLKFTEGVDMVNIFDLEGRQDFSGNTDAGNVATQEFNQTHLTDKIEFLPLQWKNLPCARLEFYGEDAEDEYEWYIHSLRNTTATEFVGDAIQEFDSVHLNSPGHMRLIGFNIPCLADPKYCLRQFTLSLNLSISDATAEGSILTTSDYNTSLVGTSVFVEKENLVVIVQTRTRVWRASGSVTPLVNNFRMVEIFWSYVSHLELIINNGAFYGYQSLRQSPLGTGAKENYTLIIGGGLDFSIWFVGVTLTHLSRERKNSVLLDADGFFSEWSSWSYCSKTCGDQGTEWRSRKCNGHQFRGIGCSSLERQYRPCIKPSCEDRDGVLREVWLNKDPEVFNIKNVFSNYASHLDVVANFSCSQDSRSFSGLRLRAFLFANQTGSFSFQLSCSYQCELWLSSDDEENNKVKLLSIDENGSSDHTVTKTVTSNRMFNQEDHHYIEVRSFELRSERDIPLLKITGPMANINDFSLVRHKPDCYHGLGVESGVIKDSQIGSLKVHQNSPSSIFGRLHSRDPWCVKEWGDNYFKIDLVDLHWVSGIAIQGFGNTSRLTEVVVYRQLDHDLDSDLTDLEDSETFLGNDDTTSVRILNFSRPLRARMVCIRVISYVGRGCLRMDVIGHHAGNLAIGKHTIQSGAYVLDIVHESSYAVDGSFLRSGFAHCALTDRITNPFWKIDLGKSYYISEVMIIQRDDSCCLDRLDNFEIRIGNANSSGALNPRCGGLHSLAPNLVSKLIRCDPYNYGQFLTITILGVADMALCEVSIFQIENDTLMSNWSECSVTCGEGFQYRQSVCIKPYYCKPVYETRRCTSPTLCQIYMQNCRQLLLQGHSQSGIYVVRPDPNSTNETWVYCDQDTEGGGWMILQKRTNDTLDFDQSWEAYRYGFGNVNTSFWIGNENLHQLTKNVTHQFLLLITYSDGTIRRTECDSFNVSSVSNHYQLGLGNCIGPDARNFSFSNNTKFSTKDADHGLGALTCADDLTGGWWYGSCDSLRINGELLTCSPQKSCPYNVIMMIRPSKVDGGWSHWASWEMCTKPCGAGNATRFRYCTHPPPSDNGAFCEGHSNESRACNTHQCQRVELNITLKFTEETWDAELLDRNTPTGKTLFEKISANVKAIYNNDPAITVLVRSFREGSVIADIAILFEAIDGQQLVALQEDLDQDGLLNENMPVVYDYHEIFVSEAVPFEPPDLVDLRNISSTSLYVAWQPPNVTSLQQRIGGYRIYYKKQEDTSLTMLTLTVPASVLDAEIKDLEMFTNYTVRVCAYASTGNGLPTIAYHVSTDEDVPSAGPVIISAMNVSSTSLYVKWQAVNISSFNGYPLGYILYFGVKNGNMTAFMNTSVDDYQITNITIPGLIKYTQYELFMTATTIKGEGIRGEVANFTTDEDVPSRPPSNITIQNKTSTSLHLSWRKIPNEWIHGILRGYHITYWPLDNINATKNATAEPGVTEFKLEELIKFTNYSVSIAGFTSKGVGNSSEIIAQTCEDVPSRSPDNLLVFNVSTTAINVTWSPIPKEYAHGIIRGYIVWYDDNHRHSGNVSLPPSQTQLLLTGLRSYTFYNISILGFTKVGNGPIASVLKQTNDGAPSRKPWDLTCPSVSSYTISIQWFRFTPDLTGSTLSGYTISYWMVDPPLSPNIVNITVAPYVHSYVLEGLRGFTVYSIEMFVFNSVGRSNTSKILCKTDEGKPLAYPANLKATSRLAPDKILVEWEHVPSLQVIGIRRGYTLFYRRVKDVQKSVQEKEKKMSIFDPSKTGIVLQGLDFFSEYSIRVAVFNTLLSGDPSKPVNAETCRCLRDFYFNWCKYIPYANTTDSGIFPPLAWAMVVDVCGNCSEFSLHVHFDRDSRGFMAQKSSLLEVKQSINEENQINFPVLGRKDGSTSTSFSFLPVVDSPGSVFVTRKPQLKMTVSYAMVETVINTLPLLGFSVITAWLAGICIWFLECKKNDEHFPRSFIRGSSEGFWWSFISMTTVGYGDRSPVTILGRLFSVFWTLYGLVITSLVIGSLTAALTASIALTTTDTDIYQAEIAALENSSEYKLGLAKGALVNTGRNFSSIISILHAVKVGSVEGALLDMYVAASLQELRSENSPLMVKTIIANPTTYGIALSGHAKKLQKPFWQYFKNNAAFVAKTLEENTRPIEENDNDESGKDDSDDSESEINVLAPDSPIIKEPLLYSLVSLGAAAVIGLFLHCTLCKRLRRKTTSRNSVLPVSSSHEHKAEMKKTLQVFCDDLQQTIINLKERHREELQRVSKQQIC